MARFNILAENKRTGDLRSFIYDNQTSELLRSDGTPVIQAEPRKFAVFEPTSKQSPKIGKAGLRIVKIQLGLSCNYSCTYCSQRFVPHAEETSQRDVPEFMNDLPLWFDGGPDKDGSGCNVQFWGGEPFVYWKTLKPLAEDIRARFPKIALSLVTNGSLLDLEKNAWLDRLGFTVGISHDGPGYHVRGADPLDDPEKRAAILDLFNRLAPSRISINAMMHRGNDSRAAVNAFLVDVFGPDVRIGEGSFIDAYDEGGLDSSVPDAEWGKRFAGQALDEIKAGKTMNMQIAHNKMRDFIDSIKTARPASAIGQKCGMDRRDTVAVSLKGEVLTCQNLSASATAPNGESHNIGHVSDLAAVKLNTSTHWRQRPDCPKCPVLQLCKGSCMFLEGERWDASCLSSYFNSVSFFALGIEYLTGFSPIRIDGDFPEDRKEPFSAKPIRKIIQIKALA